MAESATPQGFWEALGIGIAAIGTSLLALLRGRGQKAEMARLRLEMKALGERITTINLVIAALPPKLDGIDARCERIEARIQRIEGLMDRPPERRGLA